MKASGMALPFFSCTLFLAAALMFAVQPMVGKMLLPLVGGTPAGWIVAMSFFQIMLLLGYLLAHGLSRQAPLRHGFIYIACLLAGTAFLPVALSAQTGAMPGPAGIFLLLAIGAGVPFIALSATSSTLQRLFTLTGHSSSGDPYFLYMASNLGSFGGLLLYPLVIERKWTLDEQSWALTVGYGLLVLMSALCLLVTKKTAQEAPTAEQPAAPLAPGLRLRWLALAFVPSSMLLGITTYLTTDVISAPMIWVPPLALYLLTFVAAFKKKPLAFAATAQKWQPFVIVATLAALPFMHIISWLGVILCLVFFTLVAFACHAQLAALRPLGSNSRLTEYYLLISTGGALGGVLNAFIIPHVFDRLHELPLIMLASYLLHPAFDRHSRLGQAYIVLLSLSVLLALLPEAVLTHTAAHMIFSGLCAIVLLGLVSLEARKLMQPLSLLLCMTMGFMITQFTNAESQLVASLRNFYGTIRIFDGTLAVGEQDYVVRSMMHGSTIHGLQVLDPHLEKEPTTYHARVGPLGDIFETYHPKKVAVIGLGAGVANCFYMPGRSFTYFEIDPDVVAIARQHFTFLEKCKSAKEPVILTGDGRLELAKLEGEKFDLIIIDAFTSDSIPTHLLTKEAFKLYFDRLEENGVLGVHISNRYFMLWDVVTATAASLNLPSRLNHYRSETMPFFVAASDWMVVAKQAQIDALPPAQWQAMTPSPSILPWTDNYSSLLDTMVFAREFEE